MPGTFRVLSTPPFEREFRAIARQVRALPGALEQSIQILSQDPHNRSGQHKIKKLTGVKPGDGQWRLRWREYRLRYDIFGNDVLLQSFRHRKDAY